MNDQGTEMLGESDSTKYIVQILGLHQTKSPDKKSGRIVVYGDSNCIDSSHLDTACYWMLDAMLEFTATSHMPSVFKDNQLLDWEEVTDTGAPHRMEGNRLYRYSNVLEKGLGEAQARPIPPCPHLIYTQPVPLNVSAPGNLYQSQKLLSLIEEVNVVLPMDNNIKDASGLDSKGEFIEWSWRNKPSNVSNKTDDFDVTLTFLVFLSIVVVYYGFKWYKPKPKKRKLCKRLLSIVNCRRTSTV